MGQVCAGMAGAGVEIAKKQCANEQRGVSVNGMAGFGDQSALPSR
jgi:hypothetical protein